MPWKETTTMSQRTAFIEQAKAEGANISALCRTFGISRKTAYKWLKRERESGAAGLEDQSRRPRHSPNQTVEGMESEVLCVRNAHPVWGGRKIRRVLQNQGQDGVPAASTITAILRRHERIDAVEAQKHKPFQRFEREQPNELWQMDFKGFFALQTGGYCHPLTVIDDHSRFLVGLKACPNETYTTVQNQLTTIFEQFGLPDRLLMDNGSPWGDDLQSRHTILTSWLLRLGIAISHGRPFHPQTQGKDERLNRTLLEEVISQHAMASLPESQAHFDAWQHVYNYIRPHEALQLDTPSSHYHPSFRPFPLVLPPVTYEPNDVIRKVDDSGKIFFHNRRFRVGKAFRHQPVALRPTETDGIFQVFFCKSKVAKIDLHQHNC
jgi:transposase InsO family protein